MSLIKRNYLSDDIGSIANITRLICECFDKHQKDVDGLDELFIMNYVLMNGKGHYNPLLVKDVVNFISNYGY